MKHVPTPTPYVGCFFLVAFSLLIGCSPSGELVPSEKMSRVRAYLQAERYYDALALLHTFDNRRGNTPEYYLMQGLSAFKLQDYQQAAASLEISHPKSIHLQAFLAYIYLLLGDSIKARSLLDELERQYGSQEDIALLKGNINLKEHNYAEAERYFHLVLTLNSINIKAYIGLGNIYLLRREYEKSEEMYLYSIILSNNDIRPYISLSHYYLAMARNDDAEYTILHGLSRFPDDIYLLMELNSIYTKTGKIVNAIKILDRTQSLVSNSDNITTRIARNYFALNKVEDAYRFIQDLISRNGEYYYGFLLLGEYYLRKDDLELSAHYFSKAVAKNYNSYVGNYYLGVISLMNGKPKLAMQFLEKSVLNYPSFANSHLLIATVYIYFRKYNLASEHARLVLQLDPGNTGAHLINGIALYFQNQLTQAKYEFEVVNLFDSTISMAYIFQALILLEEGKYNLIKDLSSKGNVGHQEQLYFDLAMLRFGIIDIETFIRNMTLFDNKRRNYLIYLLVAHFYHEKNEMSTAEQFYKMAMAANDSNGISYYCLAQIETVRDNRQQAIFYLQKAIETNPSFAKSYLALGSLYERWKDYHKAVMVYEEGLRHAPENSMLLNNLAWVKLVHFSDKSSTYPNIRKGLSLTPEDPDIQDTLAWWYYLNEDYQQAILLLKKIVKAYPHGGLYRYHLGMAHLKAGEKQAALANLRQAMELGLDNEYTAAIMEIIK